MSEKIQPLAKCRKKPMNLARSRLGVIIVPSKYGMFMRVRPMPWLPARIDVSTTVLANPHNNQPLPNSLMSLQHTLRRRFREAVIREQERCRIHDLTAASLRISCDLRIPG